MKIFYYNLIWFWLYFWCRVCYFCCCKKNCNLASIIKRAGGSHSCNLLRLMWHLSSSNTCSLFIIKISTVMTLRFQGKAFLIQRNNPSYPTPDISEGKYSMKMLGKRKFLPELFLLVFVSDMKLTLLNSRKLQRACGY